MAEVGRSGGEPPLQFQFTGSGGEYFRVWITTLFLTILTLGIYSAWAKVRRNRYFYGNTRLGDSSFEYLADPKVIFRGRMIAFGVFAGYSAITQLWPLTALPFMLVFAALVPWVIVRALSFRARNTGYRNLRFDFHGTYQDALRVYVLLPMLILITFGLIHPYIAYRQKKLIVENSLYGKTKFKTRARPRDFYWIYGPIMLVLVGGILMGVALFQVSPLAAGVLGAVLYVYFFAYVATQVSNLVYNTITLAGHSFRSDLKPSDMFLLYVTNALGIVLTLGLFIPFAKVRLAKYRAAHLLLLPAGDLDNFVAAEREKVRSTGEEMGEMFDLDIAAI